MRSVLPLTNKQHFAVGATLAMLGLAALTHAAAESIGAAPQIGGETPRGQASILGSWRVERYVLRDGRNPRVDGSILFTENAWAVLFFVVDEAGEARRGSGEGGTYTLDGDRLTFFHLYTMQGGAAIAGYDATNLSLTLRTPEAAASEECAIEVTAERLTIRFPSGNRMEFSRTSR